MQVKKLEIFGFKSFAHRLELELQPGITGIIGPNGCGKSNIGDAIRWVVGENSMKSLRASKLEDVIFKGCDHKKPLSMAEVTLTFKDENGILQARLPEVSITRRVFRDGESEFLINNQPVRLKDIVELFMDTGVGPDSYSIIDGDMVDAILTSNKDDRRDFFEHAAGIKKYKVRIHHAQDKLASVSEDLQRVNDIVFEVDKNVRSLKAQMQKAVRHNRLMEELKSVELELTGRDFLIKAAALQKVEEETGKLYALKQKELADLARAEAKEEEVRLNEAEVGEGFLKNDLKVKDQNQIVQNNEKEILVLEEKRGYFIQDIRNRALEIKNIKKTQRELDRKVRGLENTEEELENKIQKIKNEFDDQNRILAQFEEAQKILKNGADKKRQEYDEILAQEQKLNSRLTELKALLNSLCNQKEQFDDRINQLKDQFNDKQEKMNSMIKLKHEKENIVKELETRINDLREKIVELKNSQTTLDREKNSAREVLVKDESRLNILERLERELTGYGNATKELLKIEDKDISVCGVMADMITAREGFEKSLEHALENMLDAVVVDTQEQAMAVIKMVRDREWGSAGVLALDAGQGCGFDTLPEGLLEEQGVLGAVRDFINIKEHGETAIGLLISNTVIVESLDRAMDLRRKYPVSIIFVTIEGDSVGPGFFIRAGGRSQGHGILTRRSEITRYRNRITEHEQKLEKINMELSLYADNIEENETKEKELNVMLKRERESFIEIQGELRNLSFQLHDMEKRNQEMSNSLKIIDEEMIKINQEISSLESKNRDKKDLLTKIKESLEHDEVLFNEADEKVRELKEMVSGLHLKVVTLEVEKKTVIRELDDVSKRLKELGESLIQVRGKMRSLCAGLCASLTRIKDITEAQAKAIILEEQLIRERDEIKQRIDELRHIIQGLSEEIKKYRINKDKLQEQIHGIELNASMLVNEIQILKKRLEEKFDIDPVNFLENNKILTSEEQETGLLEKRLEEIKDKLENMGPINPMAIGQYQEESGRLEFLKKQKADLEDAKDSLEKTISKANKVARELFIESFEKIRKNFIETFSALFIGGEADIFLEEGQDPLEADIILKARPSGKRLQTIQLLSSGERTMTAISLLFAIFLVRPSPFCLLDEIDAPLDDANIKRFLTLLEKFSRKTQFFIITHNKKTMEAAKILYGVTMEVPGISSIISVKLEDSDEFTKKNKEDKILKQTAKKNLDREIVSAAG